MASDIQPGDVIQLPQPYLLFLGDTTEAAYAKTALESWGIQNVQYDAWDTEFGRGWQLKKFSLQSVEPVYFPVIAYPKAWTPGMVKPGPVQAEAIYLDVKTEAVRVVIGLDEALPSMRNLVLIGSPARMGGEVMGLLAVLGPTRMDYQHTITAVSYIARLFDKVLNENE